MTMDIYRRRCEKKGDGCVLVHETTFKYREAARLLEEQPKCSDKYDDSYPTQSSSVFIPTIRGSPSIVRSEEEEVRPKYEVGCIQFCTQLMQKYYEEVQPRRLHGRGGRDLCV